MLNQGDVFAGYRIERMLGAGGMGTVYLARNPDLPRSEALKVLAAELSRDPGFRARFIREADVAAGLDHPNIVAVHQRGEFEGQLWIAMQFVDGGNAEDAVRPTTMTAHRAVYVIGEIAKALDCAHQRGVVHRDIKPANFLLSASIHGNERVLLGDFGIARALDDATMTSTGSVLATLSYAAPEVLAGDAFDGRADLYSLGCTLFRLLAGEEPFSHAPGAAALVAAHLHRPPPTVSDRVPGLSTAMDAVIATAMAKDPAHRYASAGELAAAAVAALPGQAAPWGVPRPIPAPYGGRIAAATSPPWWQHPAGPVTVLSSPPARRRRRSSWAAAAAAAVVATVAIGTVVATSDTRPTAIPLTSTAVGPTSTTTPSPRRPPKVTASALPTLLPSVEDYKNFMGLHDLEPPTSEPGQVPNNVIDRAECKPVFGGGAPESYDMTTLTGYYVQLVAERNGKYPAPQSAGAVVLAFRDAGAAQRQLARLAAVWRQCGGSTMTLTSGKLKPVSVSMSVPTEDNGITTMVAEVHGPVVRARDDRAIAAKNNVVIDVGVLMTNTDRGQQATLDIANYILDKIPG